MLISVSIVVYNNSFSQIQKVINSICSFGENRFNIFIIDNSRNNNSSVYLSYDNLEYFHNPSNPGYGAGHNIAIKNAIDIGSKYHIVLNPDIYFDKEVIPEILSLMEKNTDIGNVMPKVFYPDGSIQYLCKLLPTPYDWIGRRFNPFNRLVETRNELFELRFSKYEKQMNVPYLSGCFMFLRLDALSKVGLFDENIFMYGEETDLGRRLIQSGYRNVFFPKVTIYHEFQKGSHKSWRLTLIGIKSAIYYFNKWGWFFDKSRKEINEKCLKELSYNQ
jgi:GT2 family glycosyltransferase